MLVRLRFPAFVFLSLLLAVVASYAQTPDTGGVVLDPSVDLLRTVPGVMAVRMGGIGNLIPADEID